MEQVLELADYRQLSREYNKLMLMKISRMTPRSKQKAMIKFIHRMNMMDESEDDDGSTSQRSDSSRHE